MQQPFYLDVLVSSVLVEPLDEFGEVMAQVKQVQLDAGHLGQKSCRGT